MDIDGSTSNTKLRLLETACEAAGGPRALAAWLGVRESVLFAYMAGAVPMPDLLFLKALDFLLDQREGPFMAPTAADEEPRPLPGN